MRQIIYGFIFFSFYHSTFLNYLPTTCSLVSFCKFEDLWVLLKEQANKIVKSYYQLSERFRGSSATNFQCFSYKLPLLATVMLTPDSFAVSFGNTLYLQCICSTFQLSLLPDMLPLKPTELNSHILLCFMSMVPSVQLLIVFLTTHWVYMYVYLCGQNMQGKKAAQKMVLVS